MIDLIARLEAATAPSRKLDEEIDDALLEKGWRKERRAVPFGTPAYTASLDAALLLVPEGWDWIVSHTNGGLTISACVGSTKEHWADTAAIALCIAALRARLAEKEAGNG